SMTENSSSTCGSCPAARKPDETTLPLRGRCSVSAALEASGRCPCARGDCGGRVVAGARSVRTPRRVGARESRACGSPCAELELGGTPGNCRRLLRPLRELSQRSSSARLLPSRRERIRLCDVALGPAANEPVVSTPRRRFVQ